MFSTIITLTLALSVLGLTSATPLVARAPGCSPDFGSSPGFKVSIVNNGEEWGVHDTPPVVNTKVVAEPANLATTEFMVRRLPTTPPTYTIKPVDFPNLAVHATTGGKLRTIPVKNSDNTQKWDIQCATCGSPTIGAFAKGCTISPISNSFNCVEMDTPSSGATLSLKSCVTGPKQKFKFVGA